MDQFRKRDTHNAMGLVLALQGQFKEAREQHLNALNLCLRQRCTNVAMLTYYYLGQVEHRAAPVCPKSGEHYWKKGRSLGNKLKAKAVRYACFNHAIYESVQDVPSCSHVIIDLFMFTESQLKCSVNITTVVIYENY